MIQTIQILGPGCRRCETLAENVAAAVKELGLRVKIEKVTDITVMARMGVLTTPALAVDGTIQVSGRLLSVRQVKELLGKLDG